MGDKYKHCQALDWIDSWMAPPKKFTDEQLKAYLKMDFTHIEIARLFHVTEEAVRQRVAKLSKIAAIAVPVVVASAQASVWNIKESLENSFKRLHELAANPETDHLRLQGEVRQHLKLAMDVLSTLYNVQEVQSFQEEVLQILEECEPGTRAKILERLRQRRTVRAAFGPG